MKKSEIVTIDGVELVVIYNHNKPEPEVGLGESVEIESIKLRYPDSELGEIFNNKNPYDLVEAEIMKLL